MGCQFQRSAHLNPTNDSSAPRRSLGARPRYREFLRLRVQPTHRHEAREMHFLPRFRSLLRQWMKSKEPKPSAPRGGAGAVTEEFRACGPLTKGPQRLIDGDIYYPALEARPRLLQAALFHRTAARVEKVPPGGDA